MFEKLKKIWGGRPLQALQEKVGEINAQEEAVLKLSDGELLAESLQLKEQATAAAGDLPALTLHLEAILPRAFALVREAARRTLGQRSFDVQLMGGIALHRGAVAEMMTGEGKTLAAVAPVYVNALAGQGVHVVTVNDYLARRDAVWMGQVYRALGLSVACIV